MLQQALAPSDEKQRRDVTINLRTPKPIKDLIDRAAKVVGKTRTEFVLESARKSAEDVLLDQRLFMLDDQQYEAFMSILKEPPAPTEKLKKLLATKSPWEK